MFLTYSTSFSQFNTVASDDFDTDKNLISRSNTTEQGTQPDHEDQFTSEPGDLFGITDGIITDDGVRVAPWALMDSDADDGCLSEPFDPDQFGVVPCDYGNNFFGVVDTDNNDNMMGDVSATWIFDISSSVGGLSSICIDMGATGDFEMSDMHTWTVSIDGAIPTTIFELFPYEDISAMYNITTPNTLNDPMTLNGDLVLNGFTTFCADLSALGPGNTLTLTLDANAEGGTEAVAYDNIVIFGVVPIPTMGQWALIILGLCSMILGCVILTSPKLKNNLV